MIDAHHAVRVAAVQIAGRVGDVAYNLQQAETLASEALGKGARIVAIPEFFTTPCFVHPRVTDAIVDVARPASRTDRVWIPHLTVTHRGNWYHQNACGRSYYSRMRRAGRGG